MFRDEYTLLIDALIQSTKAGLLKWSKCCNALAYTTQPTSEQIIQIDKYYSIVDEIANPCIDFTIFTSERRVFDEIVFCKGDDATTPFDPLYKLYKEVEIQYAKASNPTIPIVLTDITQSLTVLIEGLNS